MTAQITSPRSRWSPPLSRLFILLGIFVAVSLLFLPKPFHADEPLCIWIAQHIVQHPLDFYGFQLNWEGHLQPVSQFYENPPLTPYLLAAASSIVGWSETGLRLVFLPINLLSLVGAWLFAHRYCRRPGLVVAILICCPAFFLCCNTLMCEPVSICLWIWAVLFWVRGSDISAGSTWQLALAGLLAAGSVLGKYSSICLIPLLAGYVVICPASRRTRFFQFLCLLIPVAAIAGYESWIVHRYHAGGVLGAISYASRTQAVLHAPALVRLLNTTAFTGGTLAATALIAFLLLARWIGMILLVISVTLAAAAAHFLSPPPGWGANASFLSSFAFFMQYAVLFAGGIAVIIVCSQLLIAAMRRRQWRDELFLCLWIAGVFIFTAFFNWAINARTILPMVLPAAVLIVRGFDHLETLPRFRLWLAIILAGGLTIAVTDADDQLAVTCRSAANALLQIAATVPASDNHQQTVWFAGHSGFQYYMEAAGGRPLDDAITTLPIDAIAVFPQNSYGASPGGQDFKFLGQYQAGPGRWVSTMQSNMGAGFYCSYGYALPFVFGPIPPESFTILQATPKTRVRP